MYSVRVLNLDAVTRHLVINGIWMTVFRHLVKLTYPRDSRVHLFLTYFVTVLVNGKYQVSGPVLVQIVSLITPQQETNVLVQMGRLLRMDVPFKMAPSFAIALPHQTHPSAQVVTLRHLIIVIPIHRE